MDLTRIDYFQERYARMSDEEIATLFLTRRDALCEEAAEALQRAMNARDTPALMRETIAQAEDLTTQAAAAAREVERQRAAYRQIPRAMLILVVATALIFGVVAIFSRLA